MRVVCQENDRAGPFIGFAAPRRSRTLITDKQPTATVQAQQGRWREEGGFSGEPGMTPLAVAHVLTSRTPAENRHR